MNFHSAKIRVYIPSLDMIRCFVARNPLWNIMPWERWPIRVERRMFPRIKTCNLVKLIRSHHLLKIGRSGVREMPGPANIVNISEGGLRFLSPRPFERDTVLSMIVNIAEKNAEISVYARVI
ncbi:MAG: PilZ domain-containing protein [Candidatus Omnitrophica bacterium]|nr:PilZ domain-containing protein [Candidatus Omnitrophota bacterium]